ncbi:MAG: hypothetical protein AABZ55_05380 [Bdellovibrionota bacterium]
MKKIKLISSFLALVLTLQMGQGVLAPKKADAMVIGILTGNVPLAVFGGLILFPLGGAAGYLVGFGLGYGGAKVVGANSHDANGAGDAGGGILAIAMEVLGLVLDDEGKPVALGIGADAIEKIGMVQGYSRAEVETIQRDVALIDQYISESDPVNIDLSSLDGAKDVKTPSYQTKFKEVIARASNDLSEKINREKASQGLVSESVQIHEVTAQFILALQGVAN